MTRYLFTVLAAVMMLASSHARGAGRDGADLESQPSAALIGRAESYIEADTLLDRAVAALSVVANRYYAKPADKAARKDATVAMNQLGKIYSFRFYDFRKAYTNLSTARLIAEEDGDDYQLADILVNLANLYHTCSDEGDKIRSYADELLSEALHKAINSDNRDVITRQASNMAIFRVQNSGWGTYAEDVKAIRRYNEGKSGYDAAFRSSVIAAMDSYFAKDYPRAEKFLKQALESIAQSSWAYRERFAQGTMFILQFVYDKQQKYAEEEELLNTRLRMAREKKIGRAHV